jgi:hypothetical protein
VCAKECEHVRIELFVEGDAVKTPRIRAELGRFFANTGEQGVRNAKCPAFGTT